MNIATRALATPALAALLAVAGACGGSSIASAGTAARAVKPLELASLPSSIGGLTVKPEETKDTLARGGRTYFDRVGLYSLRVPSGAQQDLVEATLQVSHFNSAARYKSDSFRSAIVAQLGGGAASAVRLGRDDVFLTRGLRQSVSVWFRGRYMFVLSTREDFDRPRTLLRSALEVKA